MSLLYYDFNGSSTSLTRHNKKETLIKPREPGATSRVLNKQNKLADFVI